MKIVIGFLAALVITLFSYIGFTRAAVETKPTQTVNQVKSFTEAGLWSLIQEWRNTNNLGSYIEDQRLCDIATIRADEQGRSGKLDDHRGFHARYDNSPYFLSENSVLCNRNVCANEDILMDWISSPSHAKALTAPYKYSCLRCEGNVCDQIFSNFLTN